MSVPISNVTRRIVFAPSGTGPYAFTFEILAATDIEVYKGDTLLTLTTDYTVTINANGTGSVTLVLTAGTDNITIVGARAIQRTTDFNTGGDFFANTLNDELDSLTIFAQQNAEGLARSLQAPETDPTTIDMTLPRAADRADTFLAFDSDGNPVPGAIPPEVQDVLAIEDEIVAVAAIDTEIVAVAGVTAGVTAVAAISTEVGTVAGISASVVTVAGDTTNIGTIATDLTGADNIGTVAGIAADVSAVAAIDSDVTAVAGISTANLASVAAISTEVGTVAGISANVTTVAGISADVTTVAADGTDIGTVAGLSTEIAALGPISANITTVAGISADVTAVAADATDIGTVAGISSNVTTVAGISANVTTVAGINADVTAVAGDATDIGTVAGIAADVAALGPIAADITAVAGDATDIGTVATDLTGSNTIGTVAGIAANVTTVAGISADVTAVAGDATDIGAVAAIASDVTAVAGVAANVTTVAGISANVTTVATNVADVTNFADVYLGPSATDPATRNDASALQAGDLYFNTADDAIKVYTGAAWAVAYVPDSGFLVSANNLSDLTNVTSAQQNLDLEPGVDVQAYDSNLTSFVSTFTLPTTDGTNGQALATDGSGTLSFVDAGLDPTQANTFTAVQTFTAPIVATEIIYPVASFSWNSALASPAAAFDASEGRLINAHRNMKRCLLLDNGTVNYFLNPTNSALKADGTASVLTGADGMVMVQIPKFYVRRQVAGTITTWSVADTALPGFVVHPAFNKDGVEVDFRYYSAYDACAFDTSGSTFISGLNRDNAVSNTPNVDATASTGDVLASVSGVHPMVGLTRAQFRTIAANRGSGWRQLDWTLFSAVQVLYLTEYQTFFSQSRLGDGNTNGTYVTQTGDQNDSPNSPAGLTNSIGNASTNGSQASAGAKPGTAFMSYRGIENFYGNVWNWADGCIVNPDGSVSANQARMWWTNNSADFSDSVKTNMTEIAVNLTTGGGFAVALAATDYFFVATNVSGGSASTYITDGYFGSTSDDRVVRVGGNADSGASAGAFLVRASDVSSNAFRSIGGRLAF